MHNWNHNLLFFSEHERWKAWLCHKHGQLIEMMVMEEVDKEVDELVDVEVDEEVVKEVDEEVEEDEAKRCFQSRKDDRRGGVTKLDSS